MTMPVGPNGEPVEGGLEGDCVEVYGVFYYTYTVERQTCIYINAKLEPFGVGGGVATQRCWTVSIIQQGWVRSGYDNPTEVCPC